MAREQQARRPGHLHANETYAWALYKTGSAAEGIPYIERAMRLGTGDAMVHYRAARIYEAAGQRAEAARHLRLALDGHLDVESPSTAAEAQTLLASLGGAAHPGHQRRTVVRARAHPYDIRSPARYASGGSGSCWWATSPRWAPRHRGRGGSSCPHLALDHDARAARRRPDCSSTTRTPHPS